MIICQNCGTTNNEAVTHTCRTCGALLPVSSKSSRSKRVKTDKKKDKQKTIEQVPFESSESRKKVEKNLELQEIPKDDEWTSGEAELEEIPKPSSQNSENITFQEMEEESGKRRPEVLQEIPAQPYRGTLLNSQKSFQSPSPPKNAISDAFTELKNSVLEKQQKGQSVPLAPIPQETTQSNVTVLKQKQLEKDMTKVLSFLSKKISVKKLDIPKSAPTEIIKKEEEIHPSSMNEILKRLISLDLNIEASAIIKTDGTILASATSSRISDSLFATIGMNLSMMGSDIIEGLDAGGLKSISVRGSDGVLDLAPIDKENPSVNDMILIVLSHPKTKSGIISFAVNIVKKQLKEYLGLQK